MLLGELRANNEFTESPQAVPHDQPSAAGLVWALHLSHCLYFLHLLHQVHYMSYIRLQASVVILEI